MTETAATEPGLWNWLGALALLAALIYRAVRLKAAERRRREIFHGGGLSHD